METSSAQLTEQWLRFLYNSMGFLRGMSSKQGLICPYMEKIISCGEQVVKRWYLHGMRITECGFMHDGLNLQCTTVGFYGMWMM